MMLRSVLFILLVSATLACAQQGPRVSYSPMRDAPVVPEDIRKELVTWLADFQNTVFRMRTHEFLAAVNWREIVLAGTASGGEPLTDEKVANLVKGMEIACERMLPQLKPFFGYSRIEVRRIDLQGDAATIVGRCYDEDEIEFKARWWLRRLDGKWQLVDYENATVAMRLSTLMSQALQMQPNAPAQARELGDKFVRLGMATENGDSEAVRRLATELLSVKLPVLMREMVLLIKADLHATQEEWEEADAVLTEVQKAGSTNPAFFLLRATRCQAKGEHEDCIAWSRKYGSAIGHDADSWQLLSECHQKLGQKAEALQTAKDWLIDYPQSSPAMYAYWQALPEAERAAKVRPLLSALPATAESFAGFASVAYLEEDVAALKLVIGVMKELKMSKEDIEEWESSLEDITASEPEKGKEAGSNKP